MESKRFGISALATMDALSISVANILSEEETKELFSPLCNEEFLLKGISSLRVWTRVVRRGDEETVQGLWEYLGGILVTSENRRAFLKRRDEENGTVFYAAYNNLEHPGTLPLVWSWVLGEMDGGDPATFLSDSFAGVDNRSTETTHVTEGLLDLLRSLLGDGTLSEDEAASLLLSRDKQGQFYLLRFTGAYSPSLLYKLQHFLEEDLKSRYRDVLERMVGHFAWMERSCYDDKRIEIDADFAGRIDRDYDAIMSSLKLNQASPAAVSWTREKCQMEEGILETLGRTRVKGSAMGIRWLRGQLGIEDVEDDRTEKIILPPDKYRMLKKRHGPDAVTLLMRAAKVGALDCVRLLLRCGADIDTVDEKGMRAIDHSLGLPSTEVTLELLSWDSLLPNQKIGMAKLEAMKEKDQDMKEFFRKRDKFHKKLVKGKLESVEKKILKLENEVGSLHRRWVNSAGIPALYAAGKSKRCDVWALLKASGFYYATSDEKEVMEIDERDDSFRAAIPKYFFEVRECHVQKMVGKCKVFGGGVGHGWVRKVKEFFKDIDDEEFNSDILKCLQNDGTLEIIFDFTATGIGVRSGQGMFSRPAPSFEDVVGKRIYVCVVEAYDFGYSDVVSSIVHALAHRAMAVVFQNGGLPYKKGDTEMESTYKRVMGKVLAKERLYQCDDVIKRLYLYPAEEQGEELIVKVSEMISKYKKRSDGQYFPDDGVKRLTSQAPELLEYYQDHVVPAIKSSISGDIYAHRIDPSGLLSGGQLFSEYERNGVDVGDSIGECQFTIHNEVRVMKVSNLKLGVSHLRKSLNEEIIAVVNWSQNKDAVKNFNLALRRVGARTLVIVWNTNEKPEFCHSSMCDESNCLAGNMRAVNVLLLIHTRFGVLQSGHDHEYGWSHLSEDTRELMLQKVLNFGGKRRKLKDIVGLISGYENVDNVLNNLLDQNVTSLLIDEVDITIGKVLKSHLGNKYTCLIGGHEECYIPRQLCLKRLTFNRDVLERRKNDTFVVLNAGIGDLESLGIMGHQVQLWVASKTDYAARCLVVDDPNDLRPHKAIFEEIFENLKRSTIRGSTEGSWDMVHFFTMRDTVCCHSVSLPRKSNLTDGVNRGFINLMESDEFDHEGAIVISDVPGSGKSVFVEKTARQVSQKFQERWTEVLELTNFESLFERWENDDFSSSDEAVNKLYQLLRGDIRKEELQPNTHERNGELERKLFILFCQSENRVVVFVDGFEEICPRSKRTVISFLSALRRYTRIKICVSSRPHESEDLMTTLDAAVYSLVPFVEHEQVNFMHTLWNDFLNNEPKDSKEKKVQDIISGVKSMKNRIIEKTASELAEELKVLTRSPRNKFLEVNFRPIASELLKSVKSSNDVEGKFSKTPLYAWMVAHVAYDDSFRSWNSLNTINLYQRFVDLKEEIYGGQKIILPDVQVKDFREKWLEEDCLYKYHCKFAAFFYLKDDEYKLNEEQIEDLFRVGIVTEREGAIGFVHRSFGEFFLSRWLLVKARKNKITRFLLKEVLLKDEFLQVRQFIDKMLRSEFANQSENVHGKVKKFSSLSQSALNNKDELLSLMQQCFYKSIVESHEGILQYLAKSSKELLTEILFAKPRFDVRIFGFEGEDRIDDLNAFTFIIRHQLERFWNYSECSFVKLKILTSVHTEIDADEVNDIFQTLRSKKKNCWNVFDDTCTSREYLTIILERIKQHFDVFLKGLEQEMLMGGDLNFVVTTFYISYMKLAMCNICRGRDLNIFILEDNELHNRWIDLVKSGDESSVRHVWEYFKTKLVTNANRRKFLQTLYKNNLLSHAYGNLSDTKVFPYMARQFQLEMDAKESQQIILETFNSKLSADNIANLKLIIDFWKTIHLDEENTNDLILSRINEVVKDMLNSDFNSYMPYILQKVFAVMLSDKAKYILERMDSYYKWLAPSCFKYNDCIMLDEERVENIRINLTSLSINTLVEPEKQDDVGRVQDPFLQGIKGEIVSVTAFLVLLNGQLQLEERCLGRGELLRRLKSEWIQIFIRFPLLKHSREGIAVEMSEILIELFLRFLSNYVTRDELAELLFCRNSEGTDAFKLTLCLGDLEAFLKLYDYARWLVGEDALSIVHSSDSDAEGWAVLDLLLENQLRHAPRSQFSAAVTAHVSQHSEVQE